MRRALTLARNGEGRVSPNPMVGAVIVNNGRIIGEGFHAFFGGPHAEVNAIKSVKEEDRPLLKDSTIYVTLEPCAHHGKTPPCANLIVETGIPKVVIGSPDPNPLVSGKGVKILENAGVEVISGVLEEECNLLNRRFLKAQKSDMPWITLKWAQSEDGFMAAQDEKGDCKPVKFSSPMSSVWMHRERSLHDAIMVGANTENIDHPLLNVRYWGGNSPKKYVADSNIPLERMLKDMRKEGVTSLMVEGGPTLLNSFITKGLYDEIRIETANFMMGKGLKAPDVPDDVSVAESYYCRDNLIEIFRR
ncbi:MAG: bifunctional diaminohydroxyphosphoribosylaminopyrimidine deaminase/5-amino-6-(5-phosphoribosylamino)uracil reductase RibD [Muribaculaceae bacterium]|nr:bifunctional diaminohydroxyphosphoribosylaminopyrimidine deaminase/5-amino-6-(5-phosphoribosylamino)uracil reductase RibD [Muribaculaceae bacterium]